MKQLGQSENLLLVSDIMSFQYLGSSSLNALPGDNR